MSKGAEQAGPRLSSLQQQRSRETREKLVRAAERLWRAEGFDETSVSEVCEAAGVSKGTFYFYFGRKEDLLIELALGGAERADAEWEAVADDSTVTTEQALRRVIEGIAHRSQNASRRLLARTIVELLAHPRRWRTMRGDRPDYPQTFGAIMERGQARGEVDTRLRPAELGSMLSTVTLQAMLAWAMTDDEPLGELLWRRVSVLLRGSVPY